MKHFCKVLKVFVMVAPYVGAWIETLYNYRNTQRGRVAPYVGAWIETSVLLSLSKMKIVAPYVGAWIETSDCVTTTTTTPSRTLRGCVD